MYIVKELWRGRSARDQNQKDTGRKMWRSVNELMLVRYASYSLMMWLGMASYHAFCGSVYVLWSKEQSSRVAAKLHLLMSVVKDD